MLEQKHSYTLYFAVKRQTKGNLEIENALFDNYMQSKQYLVIVLLSFALHGKNNSV